MACSDDVGLTPRSVDIDHAQITVGGSSVRLDSTGLAAELALPAGINPVQVRWFRADGSIANRINDADFELRLIENRGRLLFFNPSGAFGGLLRVSLAPGEEDSGRFSLYHKTQLRSVFTTKPVRFRHR